MIQLKESMAFAKEQGRKIKRLDLARSIWPDSSDRAAYMNLHNLESGVVKSITPEAVEVITSVCGVSSDFLLGLTDVPNDSERIKKMEGISDSLREIADQITQV